MREYWCEEDLESGKEGLCLMFVNGGVALLIFYKGFLEGFISLLDRVDFKHIS